MDNRSDNIYKSIMIVLITAMISFLLAGVYIYNFNKKYPTTRYVYVGNENNIKVETAIGSIREVIDQYYLGEVPVEKTMIDGAIKGYVDALGDPYTEYMPATDWDDYQEQALGNYTGLGVLMSKEDEGLKIAYIFEGSPAEKNELQVGDLIVKVNNLVCNKENADEAIEIIKSGDKGTKYTIEVIRGEEKFTKTIVREMVRVVQVQSKMLEGNVGYLKISTFDNACAEDFKRKCNGLVSEGAKGLIIDLRNNTGGIFTEALAIAESLLSNDTKMLVVKSKDGNEQVYKSKTDKQFDLPVIILSNEYSASASEVLMVALKGNGRAKVLGTKSYGKGIMQSVLSLSNGAKLKMTTMEYYGPNMEKIQEVGIEPDIVLELPKEYSNINSVPEGKDNQLQKAVDLLK